MRPARPGRGADDPPPSALREKAPVFSGQFIERGCVLPRRLLAGDGQLGCVLFELAPVLLCCGLVRGGDRWACKRRGRQGEGQNDLCHDGLPVVAHREDVTGNRMRRLERSLRFPGDSHDLPAPRPERIWRSAQDGDRRKILICVVEATPGIEPGYTVLQSRQRAFMGIDENQSALISLVEN
jgi:hypothetical protein